MLSITYFEKEGGETKLKVKQLSSILPIVEHLSPIYSKFLQEN